MAVRTHSWQVQEAKQKFSELIDRAQSEGPQVVTRHGKEVAVVVDVEKYRELTGEEPTKMDFKDFLLTMPEIPDEFLERPLEFPRDVEL